MATINSGLGGPAGFGEGVFSTSAKSAGNNIDGSVEIDISSVFGEGGLQFFGESHATLFVNSNGLITFGEPNTDYFSYGLDDADTPAIAPFWGDHNIEKSGEIYWDVDADAGEVKISWVDVGRFSGGGTNTYQVVLTNTGDGNAEIEFIYEDIDWGQSSGVAAITGITDGAGADFPMEGSGRNSDLHKYDDTDFDGGDADGVFKIPLEDGKPQFQNGTVDGSGESETFSVNLAGLTVGVDLQGDVVSEAADSVLAGHGDDAIDAGAGDDTLHGGAGSDQIDGGSGADVIFGDGIMGVADDPTTTINAGNFADTTSGFRVSARNIEDGTLGDASSANIATAYGGFGAGGGISDSDSNIAQQTGFDLASGQSEQLIVDFDDDITEATVSYFALFSANYAEQAQWTLLHDGEVIAQSSFTESGAGSGSGTLDLRGYGPFDQIILTGLPQTDGTDGSDFLISQISFENPALVATFDDVISGGDGLDEIHGGLGSDVISGDAGDDTIFGDVGDDLLDGGEGDDFLKTGFGQDTAIGGEGNDTLMNAAGDDSLVGGTGDDLIVATLGSDTLEGGDGNDTLMGGVDGDSLDGGANNDLLLADLAGVEFNANALDGVGSATGIDAFPTDALTYEITLASTDTSGSTAIASYAAAGEDNEFTVQLRDDSIDIYIDGRSIDTGVPAADLLNGEINTLAVSWDSASGGIEVYINGVNRFSGTHEQGTVLDQGGTFVLGQDQDVEGGGFDTPQTFEGTIYGVRLYDDVRSPSEIADTTQAPVADVSDVNLVANWVADPDSASFTDQSANGYTMDMSGDVHPTWSVGNDTIAGGTGDDTIFAGGGDDDIGGGGGKDIVQAGDGSDTVDGGAGNDSIFGGAGDDIIAGGSGDDYIEGGAGNDFLTTGLGQDTLMGGTGDDTLMNSDGDDSLDGGAGNDSIVATGGEDTLRGGSGDDTMTGGDDADTFIVEDGFGNDVITGGEGTTDATDRDEDVIDLSALSGPVTVTFTGDEAGEITDGTDTISFTEIERLVLTDEADVVDATDDGAGTQIEAGAGDDTIVGGSGNDTLHGGAGNDSIDGGGGDDALSGGDGDDVFTYAPGDGSDTIADFNAGNSGTLDDGDSTNNDSIDLSGYYDHLSELYADQADDGVLNQSNDGVGNTDYSDNTQFGADDGITFTGATADETFFTSENTGVVCFTQGTMIATPQGEVPIETLAPGDVVITRDNGPQPLVWIGRRHIDHAALKTREQLRPIVIQPQLIGAHSPLVVSRQHGVLMRKTGEETLVRAIHLAKRPSTGARIMHGCRSVTYFHLLFEAHQIIFANGAPSESFHPSPQALHALSHPARREVLDLFPTLQTRTARPFSSFKALRGETLQVALR